MTLRAFYMVAALSICLMGLVSCGTPRPVAPPPVSAPTVEPQSKYVLQIYDSTFHREVADYNGVAVVLFYNDNYWQSKDMETRIHKFAKQYFGKAKFCKFFWPIDADTRPYGLEMLPTVVLYDNGSEVDRIKGIPPEKASLNKFNEDVELWLLKNAFQLKGDEYSADYRYLFNNGYTLQISNY
jgi:thioredoxin-like negative regulator of GroEL